VVAILAALTLHAFAQPASRPPNTPPPGLEDPSQDAAQREVRRRPVRRASPRPRTRCRISTIRKRRRCRVSAIRRFGASRTGFVSTNIRRSIIPGRRTVRKPTTATTQAGTLAAPLSLTAPGTSSTATLLRSTAAGTSVRSSATTGSAEAATAKPVSATPAAPVTPAAAPPRNPLLRIPDGTTTGGVAGTVNTTNLTAANVTLLRRRTALEEDAFAPLGVRAGAFLVLLRSR